MTRADATQKILAAKKQKGLTFETIAAAVGRHKVWTTAALLGQATMSKDEAQKAGAMLGLEADVVAALQDFPTKGSLDQTVPVDPLIYRFHEITQVYGTTLKAIIHEMFGDGIMKRHRLRAGRAEKRRSQGRSCRRHHERQVLAVQEMVGVT